MSKKEKYKIFLEELKECDILFDEPMSEHTTFRIGGPADLFLMPKSHEEAAKAVRLCKREGFDYFLLGNGSNLLVSDDGYRGVVIQLFENFSKIEREGNFLRAEAGALLSDIAKEAAKEGLSGLEFASGIPGTLGGAVVMNAGAYGGEMKDVISSVKILNCQGEIETLSKEEMNFAYRNSRVKENKELVLAALIALNEDDRDKIQERMDDFTQKREEKQPLEFPSAGSTFKRPPGYFAGKLIMDSGLRGYRVGGAEISTKHCGFVINSHNATAADVATLIKDVQRIVKEKFKVTLETEVRFLGDF